MHWASALLSLLAAGLTLWVLWRRDRPWKSAAHFSGLVSISAMVGVVVYFTVVPFALGMLWAISS